MPLLLSKIPRGTFRKAFPATWRESKGCFLDGRVHKLVMINRKVCNDRKIEKGRFADIRMLN